MQENIKLSPQEKEKYTDELLVFMLNELENSGGNLRNVFFDFHTSHEVSYFGCKETEMIPDGEDLTNFKKTTNITNEEFIQIMNYCKTHAIIHKACCGKENFDYIQLTEKGFARANSVIKSTYKKGVADQTANIHINSVNGGNIQIGNNNSQNITNAFSYIIDEIKKSDATQKEKETAINKVQELINNPIISGIISGCGVEVIKTLTGAGF